MAPSTIHTLHVASGRLFGGIEQMLVTLARSRSIAPDVEARFAVAAPGRLEEELRATGACVDLLGDVRLSRPASVVQARSRFGRLVADGGDEPLVVVCHAPWSFALFAPVAHRRGIPTVLWQHDRASGRSLVERWARSTPAALVICNSAWTSKTASTLQPASPVVVIHPAVSLPESGSARRAEVRRSLQTDLASVVILSASRVEPWKGHHNVIRALERMMPRPTWTLWIAGGAQRPHERRYIAELREQVARSGMDARVRFLDERRDMPALMSAADVFCQANDGPEPFGIVFAEALLSGLPVVTTNMGGAPEIVAESCGRRVAPADLDALTGALRDLVEDSALRARLARAARGHARVRCAPEVVVPQLARALGRVVNVAAA